MSSTETTVFSSSSSDEISTENVNDDTKFKLKYWVYILFLIMQCLVLVILLLILIFILIMKQDLTYSVAFFDKSTNQTIRGSVDKKIIQNSGFQNLNGDIIIYAPKLLSGDEEEYEVEGDCYCCDYDRRQIAEGCILYGTITVVIMAFSVIHAEQLALPLLESKCNERSCDFQSQEHVDNIKTKYLNKVWFCSGECIDFYDNSNDCNGKGPTPMLIGPEKTKKSAEHYFFYEYLNPYCKTEFKCVGLKLTVICTREL